MQQLIMAAFLAMNMAFFAEPAEETYEETYYYEDYYYEETYYEYYPPYDADDGIDAYEFQYLGVIEEDGVTYTYYSENVLPGGGLTELNENGRHSEDGFVKDGDGYIAVASSEYEIGTVVDTPFGEGKVYDTGCAEGVVDIYVSF